MVLSSGESTKTVSYYVNRKNEFKYDVVGLNELDREEILNTVETIIENNEEMDGRQLVLYALVPLIDNNNREKHIRRVVDNLLKLKKRNNVAKGIIFWN